MNQSIPAWSLLAGGAVLAVVAQLLKDQLNDVSGVAVVGFMRALGGLLLLIGLFKLFMPPSQPPGFKSPP